MCLYYEAKAKSGPNLLIITMGLPHFPTWVKVWMGIGINQQKVSVMVGEIDRGRCPCSALETLEVKTKGYHLTLTFTTILASITHVLSKFYP